MGFLKSRAAQIGCFLILAVVGSQGPAVAATVSGSLSDSDPDSSNRSGRKCDYWVLTVATGGSTTIDLTSGGFDTYLYLCDMSGNVIERDDDGGSGYNSRITRTLSAGEYVVEVTPYSSSGRGSYSLTTTRGTLEPDGGANLVSIDEIVTQMLLTASNSSITPEYQNGNKWYLALGASRGFGLVGGEVVLYIDTADLLGVTPEGGEDDWATCYVDLGVSAFSLSIWDLLPLPATPVFGVTRQQFSSGNEDPDREAGCTFLHASAPFFNWDTFGSSGTGVRLGDQVMGDVSGGVVACDIPLIAREVRRSTLSEVIGVALVSAIRNAPGGMVPASILDDMLFSIITSTVEDLGDGRWTYLIDNRPKTLSDGLTNDESANNLREGTNIESLSSGDSGSVGRPGRYADVWAFTLSQRSFVTVAMTSSFDNYMILYTGDTASVSGEIARNDDSNGYNAQISVELDAGTYCIEATSYSSDVTGTYTLDANFGGAGAGSFSLLNTLLPWPFE